MSDVRLLLLRLYHKGCPTYFERRAPIGGFGVGRGGGPYCCYCHAYLDFGGRHRTDCLWMAIISAVCEEDE